LYRNQTIARFSAAIMLLVFGLSITPKRYLHDIFANHTDIADHGVNDGKVLISKTGFNCDCNKLVATSPFTGQVDEFKLAAFSNYSLLVPACIPGIYSPVHVFIGLRGPPSLG
jgi:hypothetical protein